MLIVGTMVVKTQKTCRIGVKTRKPAKSGWLDRPILRVKTQKTCRIGVKTRKPAKSGWLSQTRRKTGWLLKNVTFSRVNQKFHFHSVFHHLDKQLMLVLDKPFFWKALHMYHFIFAAGIITKGCYTLSSPCLFTFQVWNFRWGGRRRGFVEI